MNKSKMLITIYGNEPVRELTEDEGIALSDVIQEFYKTLGIQAWDVAIDDVPKPEPDRRSKDNSLI